MVSCVPGGCDRRPDLNSLHTIGAALISRLPIVAGHQPTLLSVEPAFVRNLLGCLNEIGRGGSKGQGDSFQAFRGRTMLPLLQIADVRLGKPGSRREFGLGNAGGFPRTCQNSRQCGNEGIALAADHIHREPIPGDRPRSGNK